MNGHRCSYYCNEPIHCIKLIAWDESTATLEEVQAQIDAHALTIDGKRRMRAISIRPAPEANFNPNDGENWDYAVSTLYNPNGPQYLVFVELLPENPL